MHQFRLVDVAEHRRDLAGGQLDDAARFLRVVVDHAARDLIAGLIDATLENRASGGLYRWQARYLRAEDQAELAEQVKLINRRIQGPLIEIRTAVPESETARIEQRPEPQQILQGAQNI